MDIVALARERPREAVPALDRIDRASIRGFVKSHGKRLELLCIDNCRVSRTMPFARLSDSIVQRRFQRIPRLLIHGNDEPVLW